MLVAVEVDLLPVSFTTSTSTGMALALLGTDADEIMDTVSRQMASRVLLGSPN